MLKLSNIFSNTNINSNRFVYKIHPGSLEELKDAITNECQEITPEALRNVKGSFVKRIDACITENGAQSEHLL